jgi:hypothetical protein
MVAPEWLFPPVMRPPLRTDVTRRTRPTGWLSASATAPPSRPPALRRCAPLGQGSARGGAGLQARKSCGRAGATLGREACRGRTGAGSASHHQSSAQAADHRRPPAQSTKCGRGGLAETTAHWRLGSRSSQIRCPAGRRPTRSMLLPFRPTRGSLPTRTAGRRTSARPGSSCARRDPRGAPLPRG